MIELRETYRIRLVLEKITESRITEEVTSFYTTDVSSVCESCFLETGSISEALAKFYDITTWDINL